MLSPAAGSSEGRAPERLGWAPERLGWGVVSSLTPTLGTQSRLPSSRAPCPGPGTWLFMGGEGSPSSSGKPPEPGRSCCSPPVVLPWEAGPRRGTPPLLRRGGRGVAADLVSPPAQLPRLP